jgi:hypothetical protein
MKQIKGFIGQAQRLVRYWWIIQKDLYGWALEAISKIRFWFKVKAGPRFNPQAYSSIPRS